MSGGRFHDLAKKQKIHFRSKLSDEIKILIKQMLQYVPDLRPSAAEIMKNNIFNKITHIKNKQ